MIATLATNYRRSLRPLLRAGFYAARDQWVYTGAFLTRCAFMVLILFVMHSLWRAILGERPQLGFTAVQIIWYLTVTELVELSRGDAINEIETGVKDGSISYQFLRPYAFPAFVVARSLGQNAIKLVPLAVTGVAVSLLLAGPLPGLGRSWLPGLIVIAAAAVLNTLWQLLTGLLAFWFEQVAPFRWILQKVMFVAGGMFFPLELLPPGLAQVARYLPFAYQAYYPAQVVVDYSPTTFATALIGAGIYSVILAAVAAILFSRGRRKVHAHGG